MIQVVVYPWSSWKITMEPKAKRSAEFNRWWRCHNIANSKGLLWLVHHAKRIAFGYNLPPYTWDQVQYITKRYLNSEHRRMSRRDAWTLWKVTHPLCNDRIQRIQTTGDYLLSAKDNKNTKLTKKPVVVIYKNKKVDKPD